ncbi:MAG: 16S rRNA (guanine(966)-N(2))-methyltransferase RsmD [Hyphomicrobiaceae bacterium]|nr:16S rRNA (guanine(966)-N(2))-methyltransferase RsmD [Hyphomicrobiaceae bacterium]
MRIVGGTLRGRLLAAPRGDMTRPTSDRVRESLFNVIAHGLDGPPLEGAHVIDLFAGTGALAIEALSRGARYAMLVEDDAGARGLIRRNLDELGLTGVAKMLRRDATKLGPSQTPGAFTHAFLDPPYGKGLGEKGLAALAGGDWLADGAIAILEERAGVVVDLPAVFTEIDARTWGDTTVHFLRYARAAP